MNIEQAEKRTGQRIHTALPVLLKNAEGITRDVSASGMYFWTSEAVCAAGDLIDISVELKRPGGRMMMSCQGDVVRTETCDGNMGVAVRITNSEMKLV
jgi:hypothetical protein